MKILIIGGTGMLGHKLVQRLSEVFEVTFTLRGSFDSVENPEIFDRGQAIEHVDVRDMRSVQTAFERAAPDVVINAVGLIKHVAGSDDIETALSINSIFPHRLAKLSGESGARLITMSTDCVFAGTKGMYSESDPPDALDLYGQSKHWGEISAENCLTLRTSIIGREMGSQNGLIEWFFSQRGGEVPGYSRAVFSGFPTVVFADIIVGIIERYRELSGIFHVSSDPISKFDLLNKIDRQFNLGVRLVEDSSFEIDRSLDSSRFRSATGFEPATWDEMITGMCADSTRYDEWNHRKN